MPDETHDPTQSDSAVEAKPTETASSPDNAPAAPVSEANPAPPEESTPPVTGDTRVAEDHPEGPAPSDQVGADTISAPEASPSTEEQPETEGTATDEPEDQEADAGPPVGVVQGGEGNPDKVAAVEHAPGSHDPPDGLPVNGIKVTQYNKRSDADVIEGQYVDVTGGEHEGRSGAYIKTVAFDEKTGYPSKIIVRTDDDEYEQIVVTVENVSPKASVR